MKIWRIQFDVEKFASLKLEAFSDYDRLPTLEGKPCSDSWPELRAYLNELSVGDFAYLSAGFLPCRANALSKLYQALEGEVELLPIEVRPEPFRILNVLNVVEALNEADSQGERTGSCNPLK